MATTARLGTGLLGASGLALAGLMAYTLTYQGCGEPVNESSGRPEASEVVVFFPDPADWADFRRGVDACVARGLARAAGSSADWVEVETARTRRRVRFGWDGVRGVGETRDESARVAGQVPPPVAVVGSSTTVRTVALAEPLSERGDSGPSLLIPWATAVLASGTGPGSKPVPLLEIDPGRTFRFCPNNRRLAESVVDCLIEQEGPATPTRAYLVIDPLDPYSVDLADCFRRAIRARVPAAEIVERFDAVGMPTVARSPRSVPTPSVGEASLADAIWSDAEAAPEGRATWVVLPLQDTPSRRMLAALRSRGSWDSPGKGDGPIRILSGDGLGRGSLGALPSRLPFPIWCASTTETGPPGRGVASEIQALAEIVSAVLLAVDRGPRPLPTPGEVREALAHLDVPEGDPAAFGRPIRFTPAGERRDDAGTVLVARPEGPAVAEYQLGRDGRWARSDVPDGPGDRQ